MCLFNRPKREEEKPEQVKCETCKHWVDRSDCQEVRDGSVSMFFYCPIHNKPYDRIYYQAISCKEAGCNNDHSCSLYSYIHSKIVYFKRIPATEIEVDEKGRPIKKKN